MKIHRKTVWCGHYSSNKSIEICVSIHFCTFSVQKQKYDNSKRQNVIIYRTNGENSEIHVLNKLISPNSSDSNDCIAIHLIIKDEHSNIIYSFFLQDLQVIPQMNNMVFTV